MEAKSLTRRYREVGNFKSRAEQSRAERFSSIDILKGIGIISVVIGHAMNTDNFYSPYAEYVRRFVYLYHLAIFFFCSGYLLEPKPIKKIVLRFFEQYIMFFLICMSSFLFLPLWISKNIVSWNGISDLLIKVKHILFFRLDGYFDGAMWFVPFMAITSTVYSMLLKLKKRNTKMYYLLVIVSGIFGVFLVSGRGVGGYYKWLAVLMIPIMALGNEYKELEGKIDVIRTPLLVIVFMLILLCIAGEIELSKGIIYGKISFYPISFLGILFCVKLQSFIIRNPRLSNFVEWVGRNSVYIMGYHFIVFKMIDTIVYECFYGTQIEQLRLFPYSFPQFRFLYVIGGVFIPCVANLIVCRIRIYLKNM